MLELLPLVPGIVVPIVAIALIIHTKRDNSYDKGEK